MIVDQYKLIYIFLFSILERNKVPVAIYKILTHQNPDASVSFNIRPNLQDTCNYYHQAWYIRSMIFWVCNNSDKKSKISIIIFLFLQCFLSLERFDCACLGEKLAGGLASNLIT